MLKSAFEKFDAAKERAARNLSPNLNYSLNSVEETRNPFKLIENAIHEAKTKIYRMQASKIVHQIPSSVEKKKLVQAENKLLREHLKSMSDNVNILIEKMNQESLKKKNIPKRLKAQEGSNDGDGLSIETSQFTIPPVRSPTRGKSSNKS